MATYSTYENIATMCAYRGARVDMKMTEAQFDEKMRTSSYAWIIAQRGASDIRGESYIVAALVAPNSDAISNSNKFDRFVATLADKCKDKTGADIIIVSEGLSTSIAKRVHLNAEKVRARIEHFNYDTFAIVVPEHVMVPQHEIATPEEVQKICTEYNTMVGDFQIILARDPMCIWLDVRPGMVVRITRNSETAIKDTTYRRCV